MIWDASLLEGLEPSVLFVVGAGHAREQIKDAVMARVGSIAGTWIVSVDQLAMEILKDEEGAPELLSPSGRQEYLRLLFGNRAVLSGFPRLRELKRQEGFFRRLDQALLACRSGPAHADEREVMEERLVSRELGDAELRAEIVRLSEALEGWMEALGLADSPRLLRLATEKLEKVGISSLQKPVVVPAILQGRRVLIHFQARPSESLEARFFEALGGLMTVHEGRIESIFGETAGDGDSPAAEWRWSRSHTPHDSLEWLTAELAEEARRGQWAQQVILIPDGAHELRLALARALQEAGIPEHDPRDPLETRLSESFKKVFLPLEVVASRWSSTAVEALLSMHGPLRCERTVLARVQKRLAELSPRPGFTAVRSLLYGLLEGSVLDQLVRIDEAFSKRLSFSGLREAHRVQVLPLFSDVRVRGWVEKFWEDFEIDLKRLDLLDVEWRLPLWLERIRGRMELASPPVTALKPAEGVRIYRMSQANAVHLAHRLWILGVPASWLSPTTPADLYWGGRERDLLASEFAINGATALAEARLKALRGWIATAREIQVLDHQFEMDGSERESLEALLSQLGAPEDLSCVNRGAHARFLESYGLVRRATPARVQLDPVSSDAEVRLSATALDAMSRCSFLGLLQARWKLSEREEADLEPWPRVRGVLLHRAVERLVRELEQSGADSSRPQVDRIWREVWAEALQTGGVPGWIRTPQLELQIERQALAVLDTFLEAELEYRGRSGVKLLAAEDDARLEHSWTDSRGRRAVVVGKSDRIDEHPEGLFVLDYKTGTQGFKGGDIREKGYRLQLPFYAIAARSRFEKPVLGVQFVELTREGRRSVGLFPKRLNGKGEGRLTKLGGTNSGLYEGDPDELWDLLEKRIEAVVEGYADGRFDADPVIGARECRECRARLVCGRARREWVEGADGAGEEVDA